MATIIILGVLILILFSGCILGNDATSIAHEMQDARTNSVPNGLLVPSTLSTRDEYTNQLLSFRPRINALGGGEKETLSAYLDGSLSAVKVVNATDDALNLLENVNFDFVTCNQNDPANKAIHSLEDAQRNAQSAFTDFERVQENPSLANALGVEYIQNAFQTMKVVGETHAQRVKELKTACGFST